MNVPNFPRPAGYNAWMNWPLAMSQAALEFTVQWQQAWFGMFAGSLPAPGLPAQFGERFLKQFAPWMPRVEARIEPVEAAGTDEAACVRMRIAIPRLGMGCMGPADWVMVDAVVGRSTGDAPPALPEAGAKRLGKTR